MIQPLLLAAPGLISHQRVVPKKVVFRFEFGSEIFENARYEMQKLYSMENLKLAHEARGRTGE